MKKRVCPQVLWGVSCCMLFLGGDLESHAASLLIFSQQTIQQDTIKRDTALSDTTQRVVKGKVTDDKGTPLAGVTINIKGSEIGTQSDEQGGFEIRSPTDSATMLLFSMLGFEPFEMPMSVANGQTIILIPSEAETLEEVVVIGYGTVRRENLTGAVSSLEGSAFQNNAITNTEDGIAGKIAGVRVSQSTGGPGKAANIKIRGINSITASSNPLYVIDGIQQDHMRNVNPRDIASMEVLKDAASAAIYGARGGNGVIVITTKEGAEGKTKVDASAYTGYQEVDRFLPMMNTQEYTAYIRYLRDSRFQQAGGDLTLPLTGRPAEFQYPESYLNPASLPDNNWQDIVYHNAPMQNYALTVSGGGEVGTFLLSGSYLRQDGVMQHTGFERYNLRANTSFDIGNKWRLGANVATSFNIMNDPNTDGKESNAHYALAMPPVVGIDENTVATGFSPAQTYVNPLARLREMAARSRANEIQLNSFAEYKPIETLTLRTQLGYIFAHAAYNEFVPANVNPGAQAIGYASSTDNGTFSIQNTATYRPYLGDDHILEILGGQQYEFIRQDILAASGDGYPNDLLPTLNNANNPLLASTTIGESATASFFGRVQYQWLDRYLISASARYDGSSRFGSNNKWGLFPAVSAGWKINSEPFLNEVEWLSLLKIRGSVGKAGNDRIGNYEHISLLGRQDYNLNGKRVIGLVPSNIANENLSWETTLSRDIGLDFWLLDNRIQLTADAYFNKTSNLLLNVPTSRVSGFSTIRSNIGEVTNRGFELQLTTENIKNEAFTWTTSLNFSKNNNRVRSLAPGINEIIQLSTLNDFNAYATIVGQPIGSFFMYQTDGVLLPEHFDAEGNALVPVVNGQLEGNIRIVDRNGDGVINEQDHTIVGNAQPDFLWGLSSRLGYKGFDFSFDIQGQQGGDLFYLGRRGFNNGLGEGTNQYRDWLHAYKPQRFQGNIPIGIDMSWDGETPSVVGVNPVYNDTWIYDATFVRIRNVTLGYNFANSVLKKWNVGAIRLYIMADNLHTFTRYPGSNPEANNTGGGGTSENTQPGTDYGGYPISKRFTMGVNVSF
ncbi:SusC/RagA family TonB-linked outer membrane protein [Parapedobacter koreensis]|uniref:TonB-linked outer membrane protein, SusC/RagA family n=1 Tax=Parapedobacter koreensis TaxID=332977 RepID=A0A1H7QBU6_9SPHI|nr:TonB-dependent receptor [Parapedobacter koreensis]SEL45356.1 TonB-linked outer membrane protein, SusC/RagA family [Parapedobacter koreensis]